LTEQWRKGRHREAVAGFERLIHREGDQGRRVRLVYGGLLLAAESKDIKARGRELLAGLVEGDARDEIWAEAAREQATDLLERDQTEDAVVMGVFQPRQRRPGTAGGVGTGDALESHLDKESTWRSQLVEPGVHVIVVNRYLRAGDQTPNPGYGLNRNEVFYFAGQALQEIHRVSGADGNPDRVVLLTCGLGGDIERIAGLPVYLRGLDPLVEDGTVITYDTIGHGIRHDLVGKYQNGPGQPVEVIPLGTLRALRAARSGQEEADWVGKAAELQPFLPLPNEIAHLLEAETGYAPLVGPFLKEHAVVTLAHCYTGEDYDLKDLNDPAPPATVRPSVARQVDAGLPAEVTVIGFKGNCATGVFLSKDVNGNKLFDRNDGDVIAGVPFFTVAVGATVENSNQVVP
jgi:hypothetical protein